MFTGQEDGRIQIWDLQSSRFDIINDGLNAHPKLVTSLMSFGHYLASGSYYDKYIFIWDIEE